MYIARTLNFEIYSIEGEPVISCSQNLEFHNKSSMNVIHLSDAFYVIKEKIESEQDSGPIYVNLRIHTSNKKIYHKIGELIEKIFKKNNLLCPPTEKYINNDKTTMGAHLREVTISKLNKKIVIMASNPLDNFFGSVLCHTLCSRQLKCFP